MNDISEKQWKYGGAALLLAVSSLIIFSRVMSIWVPMPVYLVILAWITAFLYMLFTPGIYLLLLKYFYSSSKLSAVTITLVIIMSLLNAWYFYGSWGYGEKYQGVEHTKIVAIENMLGFGVVLILSVWAHIKKVRSGTYAANLLLFVLLSWCAFPYLGEMP